MKDTVARKTQLIDMSFYKWVLCPQTGNSIPVFHNSSHFCLRNVAAALNFLLSWADTNSHCSFMKKFNIDILYLKID